ncbi:8077_t:CDS:10 [Entrophospora sp. SA101]|nr:8077_t:CDS:10 [Entrophospora sp. SA101]CAJ0841289.1 15320_t:CDS:10 [Entrophospora sp. SA101]
MPDQVLYTLHTVWKWTEDQIEEILTSTVEDEHEVQIRYISEKDTFEINGTDHESIDGAREDFSKILLTKSSQAKTVLTIPPREKKVVKFDKDKLVVGLPPPLPLPYQDPSLIDKKKFVEKEVEDVESLEDYFYFSNAVDDPSKVLSWHHREVNIPCDYWKDICKDCNVTGDVILDRRKIHVTGRKSQDIEKAIQRLKTLEQIYLRPDFRPKRVPLVHYPQQDVHFKLYFIPLKTHGYFKMMVKSHIDQNVYLLIPAILDPETGKYKITRSQEIDSINVNNGIKKNTEQINKPAVLLNNDNTNQSSPYFFPTSTISTPTMTTLPVSMSASLKGKNKVINSNDHQSPPLSLNNEIYNWPQIPLPPESHWDDGFEQSSRSQFPDLPNTSSKSQFIDTTTRRGMNNVNNNNKPSISELRKQRSQYTEANTTSQPSTSSSSVSSYAQTSSVGTIPWNTKTQNTNFQISKESRRRTDTFDEKPYKEDMDFKTKKIVLQKSPEQTYSSNPSNITPGKMVRDYNFARMKEALVEGIEHVRAFKGEIRFSGRLGKVLFSNVPPQVSSRLWEFNELKDIIKEKCVRTNFTDIATHEEILYNGFTEVLGNKAYYTSQYFEIDADARNSPYNEYIPVTMYISMNYVSLEKVMMQWNRVVDVEWSVLNRISTRKSLRHDVKPFNTFIKKASVSPTTRMITYENVPDFLEVKQVKNITVNKYKLHFPFIAEVNRVEILPLNPQKNSKKIQGKTGYGTLYYTIEIYNSDHRNMFSKNQSLATGTIASWTVNNVLGEDPDYLIMVEFVKTMLLLVERCNKVADDKLKELLDQFQNNP